MSDSPKPPQDDGNTEDGVSGSAESAGASAGASAQASTETVSGAGETRGHTESAAPPRRPGRGPAWLALLLALLALGLAGWPWWQAWLGVDVDSEQQAALAELEQTLAASRDDQQQRLAELEERQQRRIEAAVASEAEAIEALGEDLQRRLRRADERLEAALDEAERRADELARRERELEETVAGLRRAFADLAGEVGAATPPDSREWRVAEAAYLLRIANQRARLERDLRGARDLLAAADAILAELDDYSLVPVREALVEAKAELAALPEVDRVALYLELQALALALDAVPLRGPEFRRQPQEVAGDSSLLTTLERRFAALFDFRRHRSEALPVLLTPDASFWWHHNLRLTLSQAQLALLRGEQEVWEGSLTVAADWLRQHPEAAELAVTAEALAARPVRVSAPDISEPLRRLDAARKRVPLGAQP